MRLLSSASANTKTRKAQDRRPDYRLVSLALSPAQSAAGFQTNCPNAVKSCIDACVAGVGMSSIWKSISEARQRKTAFLRMDREGFMKQLYEEISREQENADNNSEILAIRPNCFSDLCWFAGSLKIVDKFPRAEWYDYTKMPSYCRDAPDNYHFTFSRTESNEDDCAELIERGTNIAVVFGKPGTGYTGPRAYNQALPKTYTIGKPRIVFDGDMQDMRFLDFRAGHGNRARIGRICGLRLKASNNVEHQRAINSGFAVTVE